MASLADISNRAIRELIGNRCHSKSLVNLQNSTATFDSVTEPDAIIIYQINGQMMTTGDVTNKALATLAALQFPNTGQNGYYSQPVSTTVYYTWVLNQAGTSYVIQGTYSGQVITRPDGRNGLGDGSIPQVPESVPGLYCPIAVFRVVNGVTAVWIPATTNWDATNVVSSAVGVSVLPAGIPTTATNGFVAGGA